MENRRGRPPKVKENTSRNAIVDITLTMPGREPFKDQIIIRDVKGQYLGSQLQPNVFMELIKSKLR